MAETAQIKARGGGNADHRIEIYDKTYNSISDVSVNREKFRDNCIWEAKSF